MGSIITLGIGRIELDWGKIISLLITLFFLQNTILRKFPTFIMIVAQKVKLWNTKRDYHVNCQ